MKEKRQEHKQKAGEARAANEKAPANRSSERSSNTTAPTATAQQQHHQQQQQQHHRELEQLPSQSLHALDKSGEKRWLRGVHTRI